MKRTALGALTGMTAMLGMLTACGKQEGISEGSISVLEPTTYTESIEVDGTVECAHPHFVYSSLTLPVTEIFVKEGDQVSAGDLLCVLDTRDMEDQIALQQVAMDLTQRNASTNVTAARHRYNTYVEGITNGTDANLVKAMAAAEQAREVCEAAQIRYADYKESLNLGMDPTLTAADQAVKQAASSIEQAQSMQYEMEDKDYVTDIQKEQAEDAVDSANLAYVQAIQRRDNLLRQSDLQLAAYAKDVDDAMTNYLSAVAAYQATVRELDNAKQASSDAVSQAMLSGDLSVEELQLAQLERKLLDAQILSDYSGTVTAVNIGVGENATGVLFVIEDTNDLVMNARVPEKDINRISDGMEVSVTPKADESDTYTGKISRIAEAAGKNASGQTDTSGEEAEYKVTIDIADPNEKIRIGMNGDAEFIVYQQEECFALPNKAIYTGEDGKQYMLWLSGSTVDDKGVESVTIQKSEVSVVYEGESMTVVEGSAVAEGTRFLTDAAAYMDKAGTTVAIEK